MSIEPLTPIEIELALSYIRKQVDFPIQVALVLDSGLDNFAKLVEKPTFIKYTDIPRFTHSTVKGHEDQFVFGFINDVSVAIMQGRLHYYEGLHPSRLVIGMRIFDSLNIRNVILTNVAGGINTRFKPGDLMIIQDHINMLGTNPLIGPHHDAYGERFVDVSRVYSVDLQSFAEAIAKKNSFDIQKGIYAAVLGPSYETAAEVRMLRTIGADAVGMSTVPEAIVAAQNKQRVLGVSLITNMGAGIQAGIQKKEINHSEVIEIAGKAYPTFETLLLGVLKAIDEEN